MFGLTIREDIDHVYALENVSPELSIKTHYEALDIAESNRIHYLSFTLPLEILPDLDKQLQEQLKNHAETIGGRD